MHVNATRRGAAAAAAIALSASAVAVVTVVAPVAAAPVATPAPAIRITEFSYQLRDFSEAEFVELTNVGTTPVNMTGWSFDDSTAVAGSFDLSGFGVVAPGESVVFTDVTAASFRTYWGIAESVDVVGGSTQGLGNGDQINIYDDAGNLVDRLTYDDTPRSRDNSVVPTSLAAIGANVYDDWALSSTANDPGSITVDSAGPGTSIGSPGTSQYAAGPVAAPTLPMRITEFSYQLRDFSEAEFVELTNVGTAPVNLSGWSFSDSTTVAGQFGLGGLGVVAPGESVVFTDVTADAFRAYWGLCAGYKVVGGSNPGLGNGDQISIWDDAGNLVDRITYTDTPRSRDNSVVPTSATALAADDYTSWALSTPANDPGSITVDSAGPGTSIASPGTSPYATVAFSPTCPPPPTPSDLDLSTYSIVGRHPLPTQLTSPAPVGSELATEVSAITYNWDTDTLFVVGDEGTSVVQVSKTGELIDSMTLTGFADTEGISYVGNGEFVIAEERLRNAVLVAYAGGTVFDRSTGTAVKLGTTIGNIGLEGLSYDPLTSNASGLGFIGVKESSPQGIFQTNIDFVLGAATNGSATTENPTNLFDPALIGTGDLSDVFPLSLLPDLDGGTSENLLIISQESGRIVNVDRSGTISSQVDIVDTGAPLAVPAQTMEGVTVDRDLIMYTTSEGGGGSATQPQLLVWAPDASPLTRLAITEVAPWGSDATYAADWFELTNTGGEAIDLTGATIDDSSNSAASAVALTGVSSLAPGESAIFVETTDLPTVSAAFAASWFGASGLPAGVKIGQYSGTGVGLSASGDGVNIFAADGSHVTGVSFGAATPQRTFDNTARLGAAAAPVVIATLASEGVNGAFLAADDGQVGSPFGVEGGGGDPGGDTSGIRITEVAPFGSGNSPYAADWFEITNTGTTSVNLTGWRMDDGSTTFTSGVELVGVSTLPAGESAIFFEGTDRAAFELAFAQAWFRQNLFDSGFFFGNYTGGGVGLSTGGDSVVLFDSAGTIVTGVAFGASPSTAPFTTFDNAAGAGSATSPFPVLTTFSAVGVNGAFTAAQVSEIGSPGTATLAAPVDTTPPTVTGSVSPAANIAGWHDTSVVIDWTANDPAPSSGTPSDPADTNVSTEGANQVVTSGQSCDPAANCATGSVTVSIDRTAPTLTIDAPTSVDFGEAISITCVANDALSGIATDCLGVSEPAQTAGPRSYTFSATDLAGNTTVRTVTVDVVAPSLRITSGLTAYYEFPGGEGSHVTDEIGSLDLTIVDPTRATWTPEGIDLDGTVITGGAASGIVDAAKQSNEITIEAWVAPDAANATTPGFVALLGTNASAWNASLTQGYFRSDPSDRWEARVRTSTRYTNRATGPRGAISTDLTHVVVTRSASGIARLYVNGVQVGQVSATGNLSPWSNTMPFTIGGDPSGGNTFRGTVNLVAVYSRALTGAEVAVNLDAGPAPVPTIGSPQITTEPTDVEVRPGDAALFTVEATGGRLVYEWSRDGDPVPGVAGPSLQLTGAALADDGATFTVRVSNELGSITSRAARLSVVPADRVTTGLESFYDFDEGEGTVARDTSGTGTPLDLDLIGTGYTWTADGITLDGARLQSPVAATKVSDAVRASNEYTMEVWLTPSVASPTAPAWVAGIARTTTSRNAVLSQGFGISAPTDVWEHRLRSSGSYSGRVTHSPVTAGTRVHLVVTRLANGNYRIYVDGIRRGVGSSPGTLTWDRTLPLVVGADATGGNPFSGTIDMVAVYSRALTDAEVAQNHQAG
jgi:uncharacterized protein YjiK